MTLVITRRIQDLSTINIDYLQQYYPKDVMPSSKLFFIISRVFNDQFKLLDLTFDVPFERDIIRKSISIHPYMEYALNIGDIIDKNHIAKDCYVEVIVRYVTTEGKIKMIFPGEIRYNGIDKITNIHEFTVKEIIDELEPHETATKLASLNYPNLSTDLIQSIKRFNSGDFEGSIKFSRKVVEGIRQLKVEDIINESNRQDKLKSYLSSSFNLLSNFGEHTGTSASEEEALLAKDIAFGLATYLVSKIVIK
jgi:hypothetical protein